MKRILLISKILLSSSPNLRKLIQSILITDNSFLLNILETNLAKDYELKDFFIFIEEMVKYKMDTTEQENKFISLLEINYYGSKTVNDFLVAANKSQYYFVKRLIELKKFRVLSSYINNLLISGNLNIKNIILSLKDNYNSLWKEDYLEIVRSILSRTSAYSVELLNKDNLFLFEQYVLLSSTSNEELIKNYCKYLLSLGEKQFLSFEKAFFIEANGRAIVDYCFNIAESSKRLALYRLAELRDESNIIRFISHFSQYKNLIPML